MFNMPVPFRLPTTFWMALDRLGGRGTSTGPFGLVLTSVNSPVHPVPLPISAAAARTLKNWCLMIALLSPQPLWPHGQGEADAARRGQLAVLDALSFPGRLVVTGVALLLVRTPHQMPPGLGDARLREA